MSERRWSSVRLVVTACSRSYGNDMSSICTHHKSELIGVERGVFVFKDDGGNTRVPVGYVFRSAMMSEVSGVTLYGRYLQPNTTPSLQGGNSACHSLNLALSKEYRSVLCYRYVL